RRGPLLRRSVVRVDRAPLPERRAAAGRPRAGRGARLRGRRMSADAIDFEVHQEPDTVRTRSLLTVGIVSVVIGAGGRLGSAVLLVAAVGALQPDLAGPSGPRPVPRVLSGVEQTPIWGTRAGEDLRERQERQLEGWGWADRKAGIATIPID